MPADDTRPLLSVDIDGVIARPLFGVSVLMNRRTSLAPHPAAVPEGPPPPRVTDRLLQATYYRVRYTGRRPRSGGAEALAAAREAGYRLIALTGRDWRGRVVTERWLDRHGLLDYFDALHMNDSGRYGSRLPSPRFKEAVCAGLGVVRHIEDDPATAALLARNGVSVDLIDWPRSRGLAFPDGVTRRDDLHALARAFEDAAPADSRLIDRWPARDR